MCVCDRASITEAYTCVSGECEGILLKKSENLFAAHLHDSRYQI